MALLTSREVGRAPTSVGMSGADLQILEALRFNGRITTQELADRVGLSRSVVARRLSQLLDDELIRVVGIVHPLTLGIRSLAHVSLSVDRPVRRVADELSRLPDVPFVSLTSGSCPLIAEVRSRSDDDLARALDRVRSIDGVRATETLFYTKLVADVLRPSHAENVEIDAVDGRLLTLLQENGRMAFTTLGDKVGVSTGTARTRVLRMIDTGVVRIGAISRAGRRDTRVDVGVGLSVLGPASSCTDLLSEMPQVRFLAETIGRYDLLATVDADSLAEVVSVLDRLRGLKPVLHLDSWVHLSTVKESYTYPLEVLS